MPPKRGKRRSCSGSVPVVLRPCLEAVGVNRDRSARPPRADDASFRELIGSLLGLSICG
jgi:hypothetical protein